MNILITGATGYIGKNLINNLCKENDIYVVVRETSNVEHIKLMVKKIIVYDRQKIYQDILEIKPDLLIHLAGVFYAEHKGDNIDSLLECNITFASIIMDATVASGCKMIINTSSYWQNYNKDAYNPVNLYAATKQAMEDIIEYYVQVHACRAISLQIFDTYGENDSRRKILNVIRDLPEKSVFGMSGGEQELYYCYIDDVISGYVCAIKLLKNELVLGHKKYALRGEEPVKLRDIVDKYIEISGKSVKVIYGEIPYRNREIMNPTGIGVILPEWSEKYSLEDGLKRMLKNSFS